MKLHLLILFLLVVTIVNGQNKPDTLFIANKKYPLQRAKIFYSSMQDGPIMLPSEYSDIKKYSTWENELQFNFIAFSDTSHGIENDEAGNTITTSRIITTCDTTKKQKYYLDSFVDTIIVDKKDFGYLTPYIKSGNKRIYFCASRVDAVFNGIITKYYYYLISQGNIFSYWELYSLLPYDELHKIKSSIYILRDLYYKKNNATFYLDRKFVIKIR